MRRLVDLFNRTWDDFYHDALQCFVRSGSDECVCEAQSTFYRELLCTSWVPTKEKYRQRPTTKPAIVLSRPCKLYLQESKTLQMLHCHVHYIDAKLSIGNPKFVTALGIQTQNLITPEFMMEMLGKWSSSGHDGKPLEQTVFKASRIHMSSVYHFILESCRIGDRDRLRAIRSFFHQEKAVFVPRRSEIEKSAGELVTGSFFTVKQVCRGDPSKLVSKVQKTCRDAMCPGPQLLGDAYRCLGKDRCLHLLTLFQQKLEMKATPSTQSYIDVMEYLTSSVPTPYISIVRDLQDLYIEVVRKMETVARDEAWTRASRKDPDLPPSIAGFKSEDDSRQDRDVDAAIYAAGVEITVLDSDEATRVREYVPGKKLFASCKKVWISTKEYPLIDDDQNSSKLFELTKSVHFVHIVEDEKVSTQSTRPRYAKDMDRDRYDAPRSAKNMAIQFGEEWLVKIHTFLECCGVRKLSDSLQKQALYDTCSPCPALQRHVHNIIPYIQRYLFAEHDLAYRRLMDEGLEDKLQNMQFLTADRLSTVYVIEDIDAQSAQKIECDSVLSKREALVVSSKVWGQSKERYKVVNRELATLFLRPTHGEFELFFSFIDSVTGKLQDGGALKAYLDKRDVKNLPKDEIKWQVPNPEGECEVETGTSEDQNEDEVPSETNLLPPIQSTAARTHHTLRKSEDGSIRSWPPRSSTMPPKENARPSTSDKHKQHEWQIPSEPQPWKGPTGQTKRDHPGTARRNGSRFVTHQEERLSRTDESSHQNEMPASTGSPQTPSTSQPDRHESSSANYAAAPTHFQQTLLIPSFPGQNPNSSFGHNSLVPPLLPPPPMASLPVELPFSPPPITTIQFEQVATAGQLRVPTSVMLSATSTVQEIGRYGEELVYMYIQEQKERGLLQYNGQLSPTVEVNWANQQKESGWPFDIKVEFPVPSQSTPQSFFIEVKTTVSENKGVFEISNQQLQFAYQQQNAFHLYRVYNAGKATVKMCRIQNLHQHLDAHQIALYMVV